MVTEVPDRYGFSANESDSAPKRHWVGLKLGLGFDLKTLVSMVAPAAETKVQLLAINNVHALLESGCADEHDWQSAVDTLSELLSAHPDRHLQSGTWYDGPPSILALAAAQQVAIAAKIRAFAELYPNGEIEGATFKAFKYVLRALAKQPSSAMSGLTLVERLLNQLP